MTSMRLFLVAAVMLLLVPQGINKSVNSFSDQFQYDSAVEWDKLREKIVKNALENYLLPSIELEIRRELIRNSRETIIEEASQIFKN